MPKDDKENLRQRNEMLDNENNSNGFGNSNNSTTPTPQSQNNPSSSSDDENFFFGNVKDLAESAKNANPFKDSKKEKYTSKKNNDNKKNKNKQSNNKQENDSHPSSHLSNHNNKESKENNQKKKDSTSKKVIKEGAKLIPGVGGVIGGLDLLSKGLNRKDNKNNKNNKNGLPFNRPKDPKNPFNLKKDEEKEKTPEQEPAEELEQNTKQAAKLTFKIAMPIILLISAVALVIIAIFMFAETYLGSFTENFISAVDSFEKMSKELLPSKSNNSSNNQEGNSNNTNNSNENNDEGDSNIDALTNSDSQQIFLTAAEQLHKEKPTFNNILLTSTVKLMIQKQQYAEDGSFDYADINEGCENGLNNFWNALKNLTGIKAFDALDGCKLRNLAEILDGSEVNIGEGNVIIANSTSAPSTSRAAASSGVASDANIISGTGDFANGFGDYVPQNLVDTGENDPDTGNPMQLTQETFDAYTKMKEAAAAQGVSITLTSGYRSPEEQQQIIDSGTGRSPAAAGTSEHQLGSTIDVSDSCKSWVQAHGQEYGFILRYPDMADEQHHFRFVGVDMAKAYGASGSNSYATFVNSEEAKKLLGTSSSASSTSSTTVLTGGQSQLMVQKAQQELDAGVAENGGYTKYGDAFGDPYGEWCAYFLSWLANQVGVSEDVFPRSGGVYSMMDYFQARNQYHTEASYEPKPGDVIFYGHGHVGLVAEYNNGTLRTIEGNSGYNADRVVEWVDTKGTGRFRDVTGFGSPAYDDSNATSITVPGTEKDKLGFEKYRSSLKEFIKEHLPKLGEENKAVELDNTVTEIFDDTYNTYELMGVKIVECANPVNASSFGSCSYDIKGFKYNGQTYPVSLQITDLKVRLMNCVDKGRNIPVEGEELVPFEKYILGVTYAEVGNGLKEAHAQSEAIAARSYALARPIVMGKSMGTNILQENGQWILQLRSCTEDQVYCDPDKGCSRDGSSPGDTHYSGLLHPYKYKDPLPADDPLRNYVDKTNGQVLIDNQGYIVDADYYDTDQKAWGRGADAGKDATQILVEHYASEGAASVQSMSCNGIGGTNSNCVGQAVGQGASGPYADWLQGDERWGSISVGGGRSIASIGCLATSIAMLIAKSGTPTIVQGEFNPGTFVQAMNANGGFVNGGDLVWGAVQNVAPKFQYQGKVGVSGNEAAKAQELLSQGYYITAQVTGYGSGQHWVAIDRVENGRVIMMDPATTNTDMVETYPNGMVDTYAYYKVVD